MEEIQDKVYWDNEDRDESDFGLPIVAVHPFVERMDYEMLLLSLEPDHAKVILIRHFGLRGKKAARVAGFSSEWSYYRREHELRKLLDRQREHYIG